VAKSLIYTSLQITDWVIIKILSHMFWTRKNLFKFGKYLELGPTRNLS